MSIFFSILRVYPISTHSTRLWAWGMIIFEYFKGIFNIYTQYKVVGVGCEYFKGIFNIHTQYKVVGVGHEYVFSILRVFSISTHSTRLWAWGMSIFEYFKDIFNIYTQYKLVGMGHAYF